MITIKQASELWCPMVRLVQVNTNFFGTENSLPFNRGQDMNDHPEISVIPSAACCIGDKCAMWRWTEAPAPELEKMDWNIDFDKLPEEPGYPKEEPERPPDVPASATWVPVGLRDGEWYDGGYWVESDESLLRRNEIARAGRTGCCGLAGTPKW